MTQEYILVSIIDESVSEASLALKSQPMDGTMRWLHRKLSTRLFDIVGSTSESTDYTMTLPILDYDKATEHASTVLVALLD